MRISHERAARAIGRVGVCAISTFVLAGTAQGADAGNAFNPKISLVLQGNYANYSNDTPPLVPGYLLGSEADFVPSGLSLNETELAVESNVDDYFHGWASIALDNNAQGDTKVSVEEAYINTLTLPYGFTAKIGRFFSDIGYLNHVHAHAWDFIDQPLVYRAMLDNQLGDDGGQIRWLAPTDMFLEFGGELLRGGKFPGGGDSRSGVPAKSVFAHLGDDIGDSASYRVGLSYLREQDGGRQTQDPLGLTKFFGHSGLGILDLVYKWSPHGNPDVRNAAVSAEYFYRSEKGNLVFDPATQNTGSAYRGHQAGFYVQGVYQFMPHWRVGARYDRLRAGNELSDPAAGTSLAALGQGGHPQRYSVMADWSHSEFSRIRVQFNRDESRPGGAIDNQVFLQYIFALGSHPAHQF